MIFCRKLDYICFCVHGIKKEVFFGMFFETFALILVNAQSNWSATICLSRVWFRIAPGAWILSLVIVVYFPVEVSASG